MSYEAIGRRYARAIFDIGKEEGNLATLAADVSKFVEAWQGSAELQTVLENPLVAVASREAIVRDVADRLGAGESAKRALRLITQRRRLRALPDIGRHLSRLVDEEAKVSRAHVTSAAALSESFLTKLKAELERATGQKIVLTSSVDPALLGGLVTRVGDRVIDGSLRTRLQNLRDLSAVRAS